MTVVRTGQKHSKSRPMQLLGRAVPRKRELHCQSGQKATAMQPAFGVALGIYRTGFARPLGIHVLGCSTCLGRPFQCARRGRRMDWTGGPSNPSIRAGHLPASSLINNSPLRHFVPVSLRARLLSTSTSLPVCLSVILPFDSNLLASASCLSGREPPPAPSPVHCIRASTRANNHYAANSPGSRAATTLRHRVPGHLQDERPPQSQSTRGARLPAHRIPRWLKAAAPMLVSPDQHLGASYG